jgi:hypothetical protein
LKRNVKISNRGATPTIEDERVPEKEELKAVLMYGDERTKAAMCLIAQSGLHLEVLGNDRGNNSLTGKDLPELKVHRDYVEFTMLVVRPAFSKAKNKYLTFLQKEGCDHLAAYLNKRITKS